MKKVITLLVALLFISTSYLMAQTDVYEVLEPHYDVMNIEALLDKDNIKTTGTAFQMGMETPFTNIIARPGRFYLEVPIQGQLMKQGFDGEEAWMVAPWTGTTDPIILDEAQTFLMKDQSDLDGMLWQFKQKGYAAKYLGTEDFEGAEVFVIQMQTEGQNSYKYFFDADSYVIVKSEITMAQQGSEIVVTTLMSDYKAVDGILIAHAMEILMDGQLSRQITVETVEFDVPIDESLFKKPKGSKGNE